MECGKSSRSRGPAIRGKKTRKNGNSPGRSASLTQSPGVLFVCDRHSGIPRFNVEVKGDESSAVERSATLLALACSMRGNSPADYAIRVPAHDDLVSQVTRKAEELLRLGRGFFTSVPLSPRENEVLIELLRNRVNKEIADRLRISVRTVKFHVSSLLAKFGVQNRWDLSQKAAQILGSHPLAEVLRPSPPAPAQEEPQSPVKKQPVAESGSNSVRSRVIPFQRSLRPA